MADQNPKASKSGPGYQKRDDMERDETGGRDASSQQGGDCGCSAGGSTAGMQPSDTKQTGQGRRGAQDGRDGQDEDAAMPGSADERNQQGKQGGSRLPGDVADRSAKKDGERKNAEQAGHHGAGNQQPGQGRGAL